MTELITEMAAGQEPAPTIYQSEAAQEILQIAIARHTETGELTRTQLLEIAEDLGISATTLAEAEKEWQLRQREEADLSAFNEFQRQRFQSHLIRFAVVNLVLMTFDYMATANLSWSLYILLFWSGGLGLHAWHLYRPNSPRYRQEFEKWRRRQQIKQSLNRFIDWLLGT